MISTIIKGEVLVLPAKAELFPIISIPSSHFLLILPWLLFFVYSTSIVSNACFSVFHGCKYNQNKKQLAIPVAVLDKAQNNPCSYMYAAAL